MLTMKKCSGDNLLILKQQYMVFIADIFYTKRKPGNVFLYNSNKLKGECFIKAV